MIPIEQSVIYQIPVDQTTGLGKYGLALSCTAVSDLAESDLARYAPPTRRPSASGWREKLCQHEQADSLKLPF